MLDVCWVIVGWWWWCRWWKKNNHLSRQPTEARLYHHTTASDIINDLLSNGSHSIFSSPWLPSSRNVSRCARTWQSAARSSSSSSSAMRKWNDQRISILFLTHATLVLPFLFGSSCLSSYICYEKIRRCYDGRP